MLGLGHIDSLGDTLCPQKDTCDAVTWVHDSLGVHYVPRKIPVVL